MAANLKELYVSTVAPSLMKKFSYKSVMQIPKIDKVVINVGAGEAKDNSKVIDAIMKDLALITGQKPVVCRAKKSVANFKIREGMPIGVKVLSEAKRCTNSSTDFSMLRSPVYATSEESTATPSTAEEITPPISRSSSFSPKLSTIK